MRLSTTIVKDAVFGDDVKLLSDSAVIHFGADSDTTLTHTDGTGLTLNSTIGIIGIFDVATMIGMKRNKEDFGQTLGYWGMSPGPYIVLPFFGPSTLRDAPGLYVDMKTNESTSPTHTELHHEERQSLTAAEIIDARARLLRATKILDTAAKDPYVFIRESYLQKRENMVTDGKNTEDFEIDVLGVDY